MEANELPMGFGMALSRNPEAMERFAGLPETEQKAILEGVRAVRSKQEMQAYVENLMK